MKKNIYNGKIINLMMVIGLLILTQTSSFSMESQKDSNCGSQKQTVDDKYITPQQPVDFQGTPQQHSKTTQKTKAISEKDIKLIVAILTMREAIDYIKKKNASKTPK